MNNRLLSGYEPQRFFQWYETLSAIPHGSRNEKAMADLVADFAAERGYEIYRDAIDNLLITVPATPGYENEPLLLLQAHMDMVCVKDEGVDFDFEKEGVRLKIDGDMLRAEGTTLGADNLTGVAVMLAVAGDERVPHPPLELFFTVQEEIGMQGIRRFDMGRIRARRMVNLDAGYSHELCVSSAGTISCLMEESFPVLPCEETEGLALDFFGGIGGHGGIRIHRGRACAGNLCGELLHILSETMPLRLGSLYSSENPGSILTASRAEFAVPKGRGAEAKALLEKSWQSIRRRFTETDPGMDCAVTGCTVESALRPSDSRRVIDILYLLHTGAHKHHGEDPGIVVASSSIKPFVLREGRLRLPFAIRSMDDSVAELLLGRSSTMAKLLGFELQVLDRYPGWPTAARSPLRELFCRKHRELFNGEITIENVHGGIEAGVILGAIPDMDAVGISPTATNAHTTDEVLHLREVQPFWELFTAVLAEKEDKA